MSVSVHVEEILELEH